MYWAVKDGMTKPLVKTWGAILSSITFSFVELETMLRVLALMIGVAYSIWSFYRAWKRAKRDDEANARVVPVPLKPDEPDTP